MRFSGPDGDVCAPTDNREIPHVARYAVGLPAMRAAAVRNSSGPQQLYLRSSQRHCTEILDFDFQLLEESNLRKATNRMPQKTTTGRPNGLRDRVVESQRTPPGLRECLAYELRGLMGMEEE